MGIQTVELILTAIPFSDMLAATMDILQPWFLQMWLTIILSWNQVLMMLSCRFCMTTMYAPKQMFFDPMHNKTLAEKSAMIMQHKDLAWSKKMRDGDRHTTPENVSLFFDESMYQKDPGSAPAAQVSAPKKKVVLNRN